jgi:hypothetical protein
MMPTRFSPGARFFVKHLIIALIALMLGMALGQGLALAESKTIFVPGAGNVGTGETIGNATSGSQGRSTSSTFLYYLRAHIRIWHTGPPLQSERNSKWYNGYGGWTPSTSSSGFGDYSVTRHVFRYQAGYPNTGEGYTSQSGGWSCASAWNTYTSPC